VNFRSHRRLIAAVRVVMPIGAAFRFEWRIEAGYLQPEPGDHVG
jgi:hypothetical protein